MLFDETITGTEGTALPKEGSTIGVKDIPTLLTLAYENHKKAFSGKDINRDLIKRRPLMFWGRPGIGKTVSAIKWALKNNLKPLVVFLSQMDPMELRGLPYTGFLPHEGMALKRLPPTEFLSHEDMNLKYEDDDGEYDGTLLFLDELASTLPENVPILYQLLLNGRIGEHILPDNCLVCAAGNKDYEVFSSNTLLQALKEYYVI